MALGTITKRKASQVGQESMGVAVISVVGDSAYPTGGSASFEDKVQTALGMGSIELYGVTALDAKGYQVAWDRTNDKLKVYRGDNDNAGDGPMVEVPNTTDLSGVTFELTVIFI
jgi:hypothetical protein